MATAAEKEYQAYLVAQAQAQMMADRARTTARSRGVAGSPALRSGGDLSRYAIGSYTDDPGSAYPAQYYGGGESPTSTVYEPIPLAGPGQNPYLGGTPGGQGTPPAAQPTTQPSPVAPARPPTLALPQPNLTQLNAGLNYQAYTPPSPSGSAGWNPAWGANPITQAVTAPQVSVPQPTLAQLQQYIADQRAKGVNVSEAMAVAALTRR